MQYKKVKIWIYQTNLSGNANGHFDTLELPLDSKKKDVIRYASKFYHKCFNIKCLGIFVSAFGDKQFCPANIGTTIKKSML